MSAPDHNRIIAEAAGSVLRPMGCLQQGRSRTWLDDHGWWVGVIEFQPSSRAKGSYLNVGTCWLWYEKDYLSFNDAAGADGARVERFREFQSAEQFASAARELAERAKAELQKLRERHTSLAATARYLCRKRKNIVWDHYHAAVACALVGKVWRSRWHWRAVAASKYDFDWAQELRTRSSSLRAVVADRERFRAEVAAIVARTRSLLRLPSVSESDLFEPRASRSIP